LLWFAALHVDQPGLPAAWWEAREHTLAPPTAERGLEQLQLLSWAVWPAWPLAFWMLWDRRRRLANDPLLPVAAGALTALVLFVLARNVSEVTAMPLFLPLALMGGAGVPGLRRGAANGMAWFGAMTFTLLAGLVWLGWIAMMTGAPRQIAANFSKLEPGFVPQFSAAALVFGVFLTLAWLVWLMPRGRSPQKSVVFWAGGVTLLWCLTMTLWLPWIDYGKTYRPVSLSLAAALKKAGLPAKSCIASRGLGEAQRAVFDYHANIVTRRLEVFPQASCAALLVQSSAGAPDRNGPGWRRIWEGNRPRDRERYRLYVRE
jgi:4-amino-4-deoxy-L-arabinose transferase-like glycosyltransferase